MIYPSHFDAGSIDVGGEPNDLPYETIELSMALAKDKMPGMELKLRPWLQDFSLRGMKAYGPEEVQAQIAASDAQGASGWLIWNPGNEYDPADLQDRSRPAAASDAAEWIAARGTDLDASHDDAVGWQSSLGRLFLYTSP